MVQSSKKFEVCSLTMFAKSHFRVSDFAEFDLISVWTVCLPVDFSVFLAIEYHVQEGSKKLYLKGNRG